MEAYNLPVGLRGWFVERLTKQLENEKKAMDKASGRSSQSSRPSMPSKPSMP